MILGVILAACILGGIILITILLVTGKELNIHIRHTHKTIEDCGCGKIIPGVSDDTTELQKQFNDRQAKLNQELVNMDGVIAEVNKVMGIEVPDQIKGDE
jgi:uncharacterized protein YoxC